MHSEKIGRWLTDGCGLPCFEYTGEFPYRAVLPNGDDVHLPEDPWFLLGNYRVTLFTHVSGEYELITGQRSWGRMNQGKLPNSGSNHAYITVDGEKLDLVGMSSLAADNSVCKRRFGCGWAEYSYSARNASIKRKLAVKPSHDPYDGTSAFLLTVSVKNTSDSAREYPYTEQLGVNYREIQQQCYPEEMLNARCVCEPISDGSAAFVRITAETDEPMKPSRGEMSRYEFYPPSPFMCDISGSGSLCVSDRSISAEYSFVLAPQEEKQIQLVIGFVMNGTCDEIHDVSCCLNCGASDFSNEWKAVLPEFPEEQDSELKRELVWHAYVLEAMATYSEYYKETKIPQGTIYDYFWGQHASARDNFQHALPLVYYNPRLAKSVLRYLLKRTTPFGEIRLIEMGNGFAYNDRYFTSDQQLYYFLLLSEYLRVTGDYAFLSEKVMPYPADDTTERSVLEMTAACFVFLRDTIGRGQHGLIRLMNSDWWDSIYYMESVPYNVVFFTGESHMNTAMALCILDRLAEEFEKAESSIPECGGKLIQLKNSMVKYRGELLAAFMNDMGERSFPRRMYFNGRAYGEDNMFLEPQGFTLQIRELPADRKRTLYSEMRQRLYDGEIIGARQQQTPEFAGNPEWDADSRDNGGFWYSLNGPAILGVAEIDNAEAWKLLRSMTFANMSRNFPDYWSCWWSAADTVESSLVPGHGLADQSMQHWAIPVFCAHPHAWILYCYYKLTDGHNERADIHE